MKDYHRCIFTPDYATIYRYYDGWAIKDDRILRNQKFKGIKHCPFCGVKLVE